MKIPLVFLIGLPGSGKSTFAACLTAACPGYRLISTDTIRANLFGDEAIQGLWLPVWREVQCQWQQAVQQIEAGQAVGAIYDATNAERRQRREAIALARLIGFTLITGLWFDIPLALCLQRNQQRDRQVPEEVIQRMQRQLQGAPPTVQDGFDRLVRCTGNLNEVLPLLNTEIADSP